MSFLRLQACTYCGGPATCIDVATVLSAKVSEYVELWADNSILPEQIMFMLIEQPPRPALAIKTSAKRVDPGKSNLYSRLRAPLVPREFQQTVVSVVGTAQLCSYSTHLAPRTRGEKAHQ